ncbi:MAG: hypothetical protein IKD01_01075 [Oscillospiraceae bacterium]|nr:hypothetical protein [Oscillospiraceae bacterium]
MNMNRALSLLLALVMSLGLLTACGGEEAGGEQASAEKKYIRLSATSQQTTCNPFTAGSSVDTSFTGYISSGLYGVIPDPETKKGARIPVFADGLPIDVNGDGMVWQLKVREDAKWASGEPINADTFLYSWKMCLDPKLLCSGAGNLATRYVRILNAEPYYMQLSTGETVDWESVGIKKIDERTLEITLEEPYTLKEMMQHFSQQNSYPVYEPLFEAGMNADRSETTYGTDISQVMCSGKFYVSQWVKGSEVRYEKNPNWPHADQIVVDGMISRVVQDNNTQVQMFEAGELDYVSVQVDGIEKYEEDPRLVKGSSHYIDTIDVCSTNTDEPILGNPNFKEALYYAVDRATLAKLTKTNPSAWLVSHMCVSYADGTFFRDLPVANEYIPGEEENYDYDPVRAKELFDKAMEEENLTFVDLDFLYNTDSSTTTLMAEFLQEALMNVFGEDKCKITLNAMPSALALEQKKSCKTNPNAYELTLANWAVGAGKDNPLYSLQVFTSTYSRRNAPYNNKEADELFLLAKTYDVRMDEVKLAEVTAAMERSLLENHDTIPIIERTSYVMFSDRFVPYLSVQDPTLGWGITYSDIKTN